MARRRTATTTGIDKPRAANAPAPITIGPESAPLAPWPQIDKYPTVLGSDVTIQYIAAVLRNATTGYRREYVDLLDELLEREPHGYATLSQRVLAVAQARREVLPAECDEDDAERAREIAEAYERDVESIPGLTQRLAELMWAIYYGPVGQEIDWDRDGMGWHTRGLHWIHSRRIGYPSPDSWAPRIWDWGWSANDMNAPRTAAVGVKYGLDPSDFPGKFILHVPSVRGDYPTRDGLGRQLAYWFAIKNMAARGAGQFVERFGKPWVDAELRTTHTPENPRIADTDDAQRADEAIRGIGAGSLSGVVHTDAVKLNMQGPGVSAGSARQLTHVQLMDFCDQQVGKAVLGQNDTTHAGANGSRSSTETRREQTLALHRYDAQCLADTLRRDHAWWFVHLNYPGEERLTPRMMLHVDPEPDPGALVERAVKLANAGAPVDADAIAAEAGVDLIPHDDSEAGKKRPKDAPKPRILVPLKMLDPADQYPDRFKKAPPPVPFGGTPAATGAPKPGEPPTKAPPQDDPTTDDGADDGATE